jgi:hypothetical protein
MTDIAWSASMCASIIACENGVKPVMPRVPVCPTTCMDRVLPGFRYVCWKCTTNNEPPDGKGDCED